jgi:putative transposase
MILNRITRIKRLPGFNLGHPLICVILFKRFSSEHNEVARVGWVSFLNPAFYNPVKPGDVNPVSNWKYSSFHRWVAHGIYPMDWATHDHKVSDMAFE